ncbi:phosphate-starvation-inducible PsiE family protein [Acidobacteriota bacterium]
MLTVLARVKRILLISIAIMVTLVLILAVLDLGRELVKDIITPPVVFLSVTELLRVFSMFLLVLVGIELLEMMEIYIRDNVLHVEVVVTVALVAVARKVIIIDIKTMPGLTILSIALLIAALSGSYYLLKKACEAKKLNS